MNIPTSSRSSCEQDPNPPVASPISDTERLQELLSSHTKGVPNQHVFRSIARLAARCLSSSYGFLTIVDDGMAIWRSTHQLSGTDGLDQTTADTVDRVLSRRLIEGNRPLAAMVIRSDEQLAPEMAPLDTSRGGPTTWLGAQMTAADGTVVGSLSVAQSDERTWTDDDREALSALARTAVLLYTMGQQTVEAERDRAVLETILQNAPIGFSLVDEDLRFLLINETLAAMNGLPVDAHIGRRLSEIVPNLPRASESIESVLRDEGALVDVELKGETPASPGVERSWLASYYPIDLGGGSIGVGSLVSEITDRVASRRRAEILAQLANRLASARSRADVAAIVAEIAPRYLDADRALIARSDEAGLTLKVDAPVNRSPIPGEPAQQLVATSATGEAARTGDIVLVTDRDQRRREFSDSTEAADALGVVASATAPLVAGDGAVYGALCLTWSRAIDPVTFPRPQFRVLANVCAQTLARIEATESLRQLAGSLQATLLGLPAPDPDLDVALRYQPAIRSLGFGGDWYDVVRIDSNRTALVVGDVVGHDSAAAARMAQIRTVVGDVLQLTDDLSAVFDQVERLLCRIDKRIWATVSISVVDRAQHTLAGLSAGHPPPLLMAPNGDIRTVDVALRPPIGMPAEPLPLNCVPYEPGSILVAYTDGAIESRDDHLEAGIDNFSLQLAQIGRAPVEEIADHLLAHAGTADLEDDIALLVARLP